MFFKPRKKTYFDPIFASASPICGQSSRPVMQNTESSVSALTTVWHPPATTVPNRHKITATPGARKFVADGFLGTIRDALT